MQNVCLWWETGMPGVHQQRVAWGLRWREQEWAREKEGKQRRRRECRPVGFKSLANLEQIKLTLLFFFFFQNSLACRVSLHWNRQWMATKDSWSLGMVLGQLSSHSTSRSTFAPTKMSVINVIKKKSWSKSLKIKLHVCKVEKHGNLTWLQRSCRK